MRKKAKRTSPMEMATGKFGIELRYEGGDRCFGRMSNIKKLQNNKFHVPEESRKKMDMERLKRCNEDRN